MCYQTNCCDIQPICSATQNPTVKDVRMAGTNQRCPDPTDDRARPLTETTPTMRFGLPGRVDMKHAEVADALGFDCLWFSEEHFSPVFGNDTARGRPLSPIVLAAAVAAHTARIRIGFSVLLAILHDPLRLAEEVATLDVISAGRVNLGFGWPNARYAPLFKPGDDKISSLQQSLATMIAYWDGPPISVGGVAHRVEPAPVQRPHPPIHVAARSDEAIVWTAERGYALILSALQSPASLHRCLDLYARHGGDRGNAPVERFCFVAESDAAAREQAWPIVTELVERLSHSGIDVQPHQIVATPTSSSSIFLTKACLSAVPTPSPVRLPSCATGTASDASTCAPHSPGPARPISSGPRSPGSRARSFPVWV